MILFHYTNLLAIGGILNVGTLKTSVVMPGMLCLTTDLDPTGHGLPDGRKITAQRAQEMKGFPSGDGYRCYDFTEFRIVMDLCIDDPKLAKATDVFSKDDLKKLAITAYRPTEPRLTRRAFKETRAQMKHGSLEDKSSTWWFYRDDIPTSRFSTIQMRVSSGHFVDTPSGGPPLPTL